MNNTKNVAFWVILFLLMMALFQIFNSGSGTQASNDITYSEFLNQLEGGNVASVQLDGEKVFITGTDNVRYQTVRPEGDEELFRELREAGVEIKAAPQETSGLLSTLGLWLP